MSIDLNLYPWRRLKQRRQNYCLGALALILAMSEALILWGQSGVMQDKIRAQNLRNAKLSLQLQESQSQALRKVGRSNDPEILSSKLNSYKKDQLAQEKLLQYLEKFANIARYELVFSGIGFDKGLITISAQARQAAKISDLLHEFSKISAEVNLRVLNQDPKNGGCNFVIEIKAISSGRDPLIAAKT